MRSSTRTSQTASTSKTPAPRHAGHVLEDADRGGHVLFARVSGDSNAVHTDEKFAATTSFGGRVTHGLPTASVIYAAIANRVGSDVESTH